MSATTGHVVGDADDLFDAGLSSISATRLRAELANRTGLALPDAIVYDHTTVRSLGAAVFCLKRASLSTQPATVGGGGGVSADTWDSTLPIPVLLAQAMALFRDGALARTEHACMSTAARIGLPDGCRLTTLETFDFALVAMTSLWLTHHS
jgi:hypothetical protein